MFFSMIVHPVLLEFEPGLFLTYSLFPYIIYKINLHKPGPLLGMYVNSH